MISDLKKKKKSPASSTAFKGGEVAHKLDVLLRLSVRNLFFHSGKRI